MGKNLAGQRVFVTGAAGFIGGHLARRLHAEGAHVIALERRPGSASALAEAGIEVVQGDITDHARMAALVGQGVDVVFHAAAWLNGNPRRAAVINVEATRALAEASAAAGVHRFVFISTISVYGPHGDRDVDESTPLTLFGDPYGDTKIEGERALQEVAARTGLAVTIVRPGMVYGPGSRLWTASPARLARRGLLPLVDDGEAATHPIYIDDLIDLLLLCATAERAIGGIYNAVDDGPITMRDFPGGYIAMIPTTRALWLPGWMVHAALRLANPLVAAHNLSYVADRMTGKGRVSNERAWAELGWRPTISLAEGLRRSHAWLRTEGIL
ncbi:MAG: NAD-dependent epimerase/dehydratase family protein [Anaerolineae bacterium]